MLPSVTERMPMAKRRPYVGVRCGSRESNVLIQEE